MQLVSSVNDVIEHTLAVKYITLQAAGRQTNKHAFQLQSSIWCVGSVERAHCGENMQERILAVLQLL